MKSNEVTEYAQDLCVEHDCKLLYLSKFGSHLYGTSTPESDTDYKGIFLPSKKRCLLHDNIKHITRTTGESDGKNSKDDIDIQMWSIQYFLQMVSKGETNALDLLFSNTHQEMVEFCDSKIIKMFLCRKKLFNIKDCNAFVGYALGQAKKYGIKGSRLGVIKQIYNYLMSDLGYKDVENKKLSYILNDITDRYGDQSYCFEKEINEVPALVVCGKVHLANITIKEFQGRICSDYNRYGDRARAAERSEGIDWKALSHAYRALLQMEELIKFGIISYPLKGHLNIIDIKKGQFPFSAVEKIISEKIDSIKVSLENLKDPINKKDSKLIKSLILGFYEEGL